MREPSLREQSYGVVLSDVARVIRRARTAAGTQVLDELLAYAEQRIARVKNQTYSDEDA